MPIEIKNPTRMTITERPDSSSVASSLISKTNPVRLYLRNPQGDVLATHLSVRSMELESGDYKTFNITGVFKGPLDGREIPAKGIIYCGSTGKQVNERIEYGYLDVET